MMASKKTVDNLPEAIELSAGELVDRLVEEAGESYTTIAAATGIDRGALSRFRSGQRVANENDYRALAKYAKSQKVVKFR